MGMYVYKVTSKIALDDQGRKANIIAFAYKPAQDGWFRTETDKLNSEMRRESGCHNADRYVRNGKTFTGRIMMEGGQKSVRWTGPSGTIDDYYFDNLLDREYD